MDHGYRHRRSATDPAHPFRASAAVLLLEARGSPGGRRPSWLAARLGRARLARHCRVRIVAVIDRGRHPSGGGEDRDHAAGDGGVIVRRCPANGIRLTAKQHSFKGSRGIPAQRAGFSRFRLWLQLWLPCQTSICWRVSGRGAGRSGSGAVAGGTRRCRRGSVRRSCPAWRRAPGTALPSAAPRCAGCS